MMYYILNKQVAFHETSLLESIFASLEHPVKYMSLIKERDRWTESNNYSPTNYCLGPIKNKAYRPNAHIPNALINIIYYIIVIIINIVRNNFTILTISRNLKILSTSF